MDQNHIDELPPRQRDVLDYIAVQVRDRGVPPTYREIGDALGIGSTNGVSDHVKALIRKGFLRKVGGGAARGLQLTDHARHTHFDEVVEVPVIGLVAAGSPILAEENHERTLRLDRELLPSDSSCFALRVRGDSMIEEGIHDGDIVVVKQQGTARNGDIVVALIDGEATVKFFFREGARVRLQPAHPTMEPIFVDSTAEASIQGKVVGVYRQY